MSYFNRNSWSYFFKQKNKTYEEVITVSLVFESKVQVPMVSSSLTNSNNTISEDREKVEEVLDGDDDFEIIDSDHLNIETIPLK